jgi:hypothetical protein
MGDKVFEVSELFLFEFPESMRQEAESSRYVEPKNLDWFTERSNEKSGGKQAMEAYLLFLMGFDLFKEVFNISSYPMVFIGDNVLQAVMIYDI